jgi:hypothetical protein
LVEGGLKPGTSTDLWLMVDWASLSVMLFLLVTLLVSFEKIYYEYFGYISSDDGESFQ